MNRNDMIARARDANEAWDILIIGGGATGLGSAVDAASRGYRVLLVEQSDFAKATSSRATKIVHGGVRYLEQGNLSLVIGALRERGRLLKNAPHLVRNLEFIVPAYRWWEMPYYGSGLRLYDVLAGRLSFGRSRIVSAAQALERIPNLNAKHLRSAVLYHDGQFDDARLATNLAQTAADHGACLINYARAVRLATANGRVSGAVVHDMETGNEFEARARVVVNATGIFTDEVRRMDDSAARPMVTPSRGIHIVLPQRFLAGSTALMIPKTKDGRVLFGLPWHGAIVFGTTDTPTDVPLLEPRPSREELEFLLEHAAIYLEKAPQPSDVLSTFAGLRPLVSNPNAKSTASISRDHTIITSASGLVTITGGKWTTYRKMAEDLVNHCVRVGGFENKPCVTRTLSIHGAHGDAEQFGSLSVYGADAPGIQKLAQETPALSEAIHPDLPYIKAEIVWAARNEMARTVEDVLARRTRSLLLNTRASVDAAPVAATLMASELGWDEATKVRNISDYTALAEGYLIETHLGGKQN